MLLVPLDEPHRRRITLPALNNVVPNSQNHAATKHQGVPVHSLEGQVLAAGNGEEDKDPDNEEESDGTQVDEHAVLT